MSTPAQQPGLFGKYEVYHRGGTTPLPDSFVLRPTRDPAARAAVAAYAQAVQAENPELAADLYTWLGTMYGNLARGGSADFVMPADVPQVRAVYERELQLPDWVLPAIPPGAARVDACRSSNCQQGVFFARLLKKDGTLGKPTPVEWPPVPGKGHLAVAYHNAHADPRNIDPGGGLQPVLDEDGKPVVRQTTEDERIWAAANRIILYTGHFSNCPDAERFRNE